MHDTLPKLILDLPPRATLDPLRDRWPLLFGCVYQVNNFVWGVVIFSGDPKSCSFAEIATAVDELFVGLGLSGFVRNKVIGLAHYQFQLVETLEQSCSSVLQPL